MGVSAPVITAGTKVTISGVVSNHKAGEAVADLLPAVSAAEPDPARATILTSDGGNFSMLVAPRILTTYEAAWKGAFSTPATIQVMPSLSLGTEQRLDRPRLRVPLVRRPLGADPASEHGDRPVGDAAEGQLNSKSSARVTLTLPKGLNRLRVTMSVNQAGAGYLGVIGPTLVYRQT